MSPTQYFPGDLVTAGAEIYQVLSSAGASSVPEYELQLVAFLRECDTTDWQTQMQSAKLKKFETELSAFEHSPPKYALGERVRLKEFDCVVRFIQYKHGGYYYSIMNIDYYGPTGGGWEKEESYLSKW